MQLITGVVLATIALTLTAAAPDAMAAPQSRYIDEQRLDTDSLRDVNTIALLEIPDPEAYYYAGGKPGPGSAFLGVIGVIRDIAEMGKDADQYAGTDFPQSLQAYLKQFLSENNYQVVDHAIQRRDRFDLLDEYSGLEVAAADAYLDVALLEIGYLYEADLVGAEIKPLATAIVRLISAETPQVIYARTFQYGYHYSIPSESEHILSPESHVYESKDDLDLDKPRAIERLDRALEVIAFNIARSVTKGKFVSNLSPTMEDVASAKEDQATAEFLAVAATEVAMNTYDEKLWRQTGELAGGDAQKQAEIYIKLRANRLAIKEKQEKRLELAKLVNANGADSVAKYYVAGTYTSSIKGTIGDFTRNYKRPQVTITQNGNKVIGTFGADGELEGTIENETIVFNWRARWMSGYGEWRIRQNMKGMEGSWGFTRTSKNGSWDLQKADSTPISRLSPPDSVATLGTPPSASFDLSGTYVSDITSENQWRFKKAEDRRLKITISQNANEITGTNKSKNLKIIGVIEGDEISYSTLPSDISRDEIKGKWKIHPDGVSLTGKWIHPNGGGKWNLTRIE